MFTIKYNDWLELVSDMFEDIADIFKKHIAETIIQLIGSVSGILFFIIDKTKNIEMFNIDSNFMMYIYAIISGSALYAFVFSKRGSTGRNRVITFIVSIVFSAFCTDGLLQMFNFKPNGLLYFSGGFLGYPILDTLAAFGAKARETVPTIIFSFIKKRFGIEKDTDTEN